MNWRNWAAGALLAISAAALRARGDCEVQIYGADTVPAGETMLEFHSNCWRWPVGVSLSTGIGYQRRYGALEPIGGFDPLREQQQQILPAIDPDLGPRWEFNFGVGIGMTRGTDHLLAKFILGRRFKL